MLADSRRWRDYQARERPVCCGIFITAQLVYAFLFAVSSLTCGVANCVFAVAHLSVFAVLISRQNILLYGNMQLVIIVKIRI